MRVITFLVWAASLPLEGLVRLASVGVCGLAIALASCSTNGHVAARPAASDLSGSYRFAGFDKARPENFPNPLIDWADVALNSKVVLEQTSDARIIARYMNTRGNLVEREVRPGVTPGTDFEDGVLTFEEPVPLLDAPILPGRVKQVAGSRYFRDADGNLRVIGFFVEKGWMLYLIPFTDRYEYELVLEAVD